MRISEFPYHAQFTVNFNMIKAESAYSKLDYIHIYNIYIHLYLYIRHKAYYMLISLCLRVLSVIGNPQISLSAFYACLFDTYMRVCLVRVVCQGRGGISGGGQLYLYLLSGPVSQLVGPFRRGVGQGKGEG